MPILDQAAKFAVNRMPKVINPTAHAVIDYATAATFLGMAGLFWKRNKRAAVASLVCAIDFGMSGLVAGLPDMMRFSGEPESRFFRVQGLAIAAVTGLTDFTGTGKPRQEQVDEQAA